MIQQITSHLQKTMQLDQGQNNHQNQTNSTPGLIDIPVCSICLEQMTENITSLKCCHCFHFECIEKHLKIAKKCPNCNQAALTTDLRKNFYTVVAHLKGSQKIRSLISQLNPMDKEAVYEIKQQVHSMMRDLQGKQRKLEENQNLRFFLQSNCDRFFKQTVEQKREIRTLMLSITSKINIIAELEKKLEEKAKQTDLAFQRLQDCFRQKQQLEFHCQNLEIDLKEGKRREQLLNIQILELQDRQKQKTTHQKEVQTETEQYKTKQRSFQAEKIDRLNREIAEARENENKWRKLFEESRAHLEKEHVCQKKKQNFERSEEDLDLLLNDGAIPVLKFILSNYDNFEAFQRDWHQNQTLIKKKNDTINQLTVQLKVQKWKYQDILQHFRQLNSSIYSQSIRKGRRLPEYRRQISENAHPNN